jgi:SAM-dependent methyltransferase
VGEYVEVNRAWWDARAVAHAQSPDYAVGALVEDPQFLSRIVRFDLPRLGDIGGLRGVHLQCHIGTDTVSLARLGARMTGLDSSAVSLEQARRLASCAGAEVEFVESDVYDAVAVLGSGGFDLVYTGIGALCWLPSVVGWAAVVGALLAPGGRLFMREGHPMLWALEEGRSDDLLVVKSPYFEHAEPFVDEYPGTYVQTDEAFAHNLSYSWNHGLGEIITALLANGLEITALTEHDSVPWEALPGQMQQIELNEWQLRDRPERVPHSYTLQAVKRGAAIR